MSDTRPEHDAPDATALEAFGARLAALAETLPPKELAALRILLLRGMDPLDRALHRDPAAVLDQREQAYLRGLERGGPEE